MFNFCDDFWAILLETLSISMIAVAQLEMLYEGLLGDSLDLKTSSRIGFDVSQAFDHPTILMQ